MECDVEHRATCRIAGRIVGRPGASLQASTRNLAQVRRMCQ